MATQLITHDWIIILAYILILVLYGVYGFKKETKEDFLISRRSLGIFSSVSTINASKTGAVIMAYTGLIYVFGVSAIWFFVGVILGMLLFIPFASYLHNISKKNFYTLSDYFFYIFGEKIGKVSAIFGIFTMIGFLVLNIISAGSVLSYFTSLNFFYSCLITSLVVLIYIVISGFNGVVRTDMLQYVVIWLMLLILPIAIFNNADIMFTFDLFDTDDVSIINIISFLLFGTLISIGSPELWQRVYAVKDTNTLRKSLFISTIVYSLFAIVLTFIALLVKKSLPELNPNIALIAGFEILLGPGFLGLSIVLIFSALMSSIDTYAYTSSSLFAHSFLKNKTKLKFNIKISLIIIMLIALLAAITIKDLVNSSFFISSTSVIGIIAIATWIFPNFSNRKTIMSGFVFGIFSLIYFLGSDIISGNVNSITVTKIIGGTILGLFIGKIYSYYCIK